MNFYSRLALYFITTLFLYWMSTDFYFAAATFCLATIMDVTMTRIGRGPTYFKYLMSIGFFTFICTILAANSNAGSGISVHILLIYSFLLCSTLAAFRMAVMYLMKEK